MSADQYLQTMLLHRPKLLASSERLSEPINSCDVNTDLFLVTKKAELDGDSLGDQLLPNFYAENQTNAMNQERRRNSLGKFLKVIKTDLEREKKGKAGVENLAKALQETPKFGGQDSQQDVQDKILHMQSMITYLEACRLKVLNSLLDIDGRPRACHPLSSYIEVYTDKSGSIRTLLKLPYWSRQEKQPSLDDLIDAALLPPKSNSTQSAIKSESDRGMADGSFVAGPDPHVHVNSYRYSHIHQGKSLSMSLSSASPSSSSTNDSQSHSNYARGKADGQVNLITTINNHDEEADDSDFDDFSDDGDEVNIIEVVNGPADPDPAARAELNDPEESVPMKNSEENEISEIYYQEKQVASIGKCKAIYDYNANMYDELTIRVGDLINIHDKQVDGWWLGEVNGLVGIFPATYVQEESEN